MIITKIAIVLIAAGAAGSAGYTALSDKPAAAPQNRLQTAHIAPQVDLNLLAHAFRH